MINPKELKKDSLLTLQVLKLCFLFSEATRSNLCTVLHPIRWGVCPCQDMSMDLIAHSLSMGSNTLVDHLVFEPILKIVTGKFCFIPYIHDLSFPHTVYYCF